MVKEKWIPEVTHGALHRQLGYTPHEKIPKKLLHDIVKTEIGETSHGHTVTKLLKERSTFALNAQRRRK